MQYLAGDPMPLGSANKRTKWVNKKGKVCKPSLGRSAFVPLARWKQLLGKLHALATMSPEEREAQPLMVVHTVPT